ncbi:hypothetical protein HS041_29960 [Planomonospora sp. ID67723]|uniref:hypothetical protein n=1 Tax=Planomonospora sp. ID67723 TaxID=2738134 RepID=UPI0018C3F481|nr:hypothetical protein [Planomonospora sp. ID67723]MBG0831937.1 hypothetical protein [Planomonospora sp. ID67723]
MTSRFTMMLACVGVAFTALLGVAGPAGARSDSGAVVPACLSYGQDWRYTMATNGCADGLAFRLVYQDGHRGSCVFLAAGQTATVGSGHIGPHGSLDRLEMCVGDSIVLVHHDAGFGNTITIRGDIPPLSWSVGRECVNRAADLWECAVVGIPKGQRFEYKILINDRVWSTGANHTGTGGRTHHVRPAF